MFSVFWFVVWVAFAFLVGHAAHKRGRNQWGWLFLSILISPILAIIALLLVGEKTSKIELDFLRNDIMARYQQDPSKYSANQTVLNAVERIRTNKSIPEKDLKNINKFM